MYIYLLVVPWYVYLKKSMYMYMVDLPLIDNHNIYVTTQKEAHIYLRHTNRNPDSAHGSDFGSFFLIYFWLLLRLKRCSS